MADTDRYLWSRVVHSTGDTWRCRQCDTRGECRWRTEAEEHAIAHVKATGHTVDIDHFSREEIVPAGLAAIVNLHE